jgi:hypothetical protein
MKLYCWRSDLLKAVGRGHIVVAADSIVEAREIAREGFDAYIKDRYSYYFNADGSLFDEDDQRYLDEYRAEFEKDISEDIISTSKAVFIEGSE